MGQNQGSDGGSHVSGVYPFNLSARFWPRKIGLVSISQGHLNRDSGLQIPFVGR